MSLDKKAEKWLREYNSKHPWAQNIIEQYGLNPSQYDINHENIHPFTKDFVDRTNLIEDTHFLKTFDEYVKERLPQNFSSVLEVGTGHWTYVSALAAFFRKYNGQVPIVGIDKDPHFVKLSTESIQNRNVEGVKVALWDINHGLLEYDIVINLCSNLTNTGHMFDVGTFFSNLTNTGDKPPIDYVPNLWKATSENGLLIMGLTKERPSDEHMKTFLTSHFKDIDIHKNEYSTNKSNYSINYIITATPKLPGEMTQPKLEPGIERQLSLMNKS